MAVTPPAIPAAELSPQAIARFTKQVQPLILNKCAAGACHGGPTAHEPQFHRGDVAGRIDRTLTLANIDALARAVGAAGSTSSFLTTVSSRHPASAGPTGFTLAPLTTQERATLEHWVTVTGGKPSPQQPLPAIADTKTAAPAIRPVNRFRAMLESAANPLPLPPPQEPQGVVLGKDRD
jgi:hypothetical protein